MASLKTIQARTNNEPISYEKILEWAKQVKAGLSQGQDISIPHKWIDHFEKVCDANGIPVHHVCEDIFSIAPTYRDLEYHERTR